MPKRFVRLNKHGYTKLYGFKSQTKFTLWNFTPWKTAVTVYVRQRPYSVSRVPNSMKFGRFRFIVLSKMIVHVNSKCVFGENLHPMWSTADVNFLLGPWPSILSGLGPNPRNKRGEVFLLMSFFSTDPVSLSSVVHCF